MTPYYESGGITLYLGDCREVLPALAPVDLLLTDPPYPGLKGAIDDYNSCGVGKRRQLTQTVAEPWGDDVTALSLARFTLGAMVFCSFHSVTTLPDLIDAKRMALIAWYQRNTMHPVRNVPHYQTEYVWAFGKAPGLDWRRLKTCYDIPRLSVGCVSTGERLTNEKGQVAHPAQKPLALIHRLLEVAPTSVLDCYAGTGTTLVACKQRGIPCVGIESSEAYCEIAARRLSQEVLPLDVPPGRTQPPATPPLPFAATLEAEDA